MATINTYISMLRGINVSGQKMIKMIELKALYESLRLTNVATYIQSGNVVFQSKSNDPISLGTSIEKAIEKTFGFAVSVVLRRPSDFRRIINKCPFSQIEMADERRLCVVVLKSQPASSHIKAMRAAAAKSEDRYAIAGNEIYLYCPNGFGKTLLSNTFFEKQLKVTATSRNWRTVQALLAMSAALEQPDA
jgi:uncharacterized protein (DUF1697 family)